MTTTLLAYHGDRKIKAKYLSRVRAHRRADRLVQRVGWESNGVTRGCAVGCTLEAYDHSLYPVELGIPREIAHLEDAIFEGLPSVYAMKWPEQFLSAIKPGSDLSHVWNRFAAETLTLDLLPLRAVQARPDLIAAIKSVAALHEAALTRKISSSEWAAATAAAAAEAATGRWEAAEAAAAAAADAATGRWEAWKKMAARLLRLLRSA